MSQAHKTRNSMIIIGGGLGGLSTGCYAQMNDYEAHILEMHELPGGCCTSWERGQFTFDWCISWLLGSGPGNEMHDIWREIGGLDNKVIRHPEIFNIVRAQDGRSVRFYSDPDRLEAHLLELAPIDEKIIREFCQGLRKFIKCIKVYPFLRPVGLMKTWERWRMLASFIPYFNLIRKTISTKMTDYSLAFKDPLLREAFNFILYEKHPNFPVLPFYFQLAAHATHSAGVPEGGSLGLAHSIEHRFKKLGGKISYNSKVEKIIVENDRACGVQLSDGQKFYADIVVAACDGHSVTQKMLDEKYLSETYKKLYSETIKKPQMVFPGYFTLFLALDKELEDMEYCTTYLLDKNLAHQLPGIRHPSINVQLRSALYPELCPKGSSIIYASYFCDIAPWRQQINSHEQLSRKKNGIEIHTLPVRRGQNYHQLKQKTADLLINFLNSHIHGLKNSIILRDITTPLTQVRYTANYDGSVLGWQPFVESGETLEEEIKRIGPGLPKLKNFYFSGVWATTGGLIRAAAAGRHVMQFICRDDKKIFKASIDPAACAPSHLILKERQPYKTTLCNNTSPLIPNETLVIDERH
ncbi:MAG: NAD(P)/FAD-dependent oxidoreductase [Myxococcales bacterium]|nr:NAD(P)/FAD-dependent oxidoreductase [Myxococcales bacterium]USN50162.1 MAG: NAD(P)/FAD-dependent oxidoreductase [Myxococcales bacterium]